MPVAASGGIECRSDVSAVIDIDDILDELESGRPYGFEGRYSCDSFDLSCNSAIISEGASAECRVSF